MADRVRKGGGTPSLALQCPWSNCFPQLYAHSTGPCVDTSFPDFAHVVDHIWKFHSSLLSCSLCDKRWPYAKRTAKYRDDLAKLKNEHEKRCHPNGALAAKTSHSIKTMTAEQDYRLEKEWKTEGKGRDKDSMVPIYANLCRLLFGSGIKVPENPVYHYFVPEFTVNNSSRELGLLNLNYARTVLLDMSNETNSIASIPTFPMPIHADTASLPLAVPDPLSLVESTDNPGGWTLSLRDWERDSAIYSGESHEVGAMDCINCKTGKDLYQVPQPEPQSHSNMSHRPGIEADGLLGLNNYTLPEWDWESMDFMDNLNDITSATADG
ncbi:hypothetical protein GGS20DRAFT_376490 [Poronia punctata]|nr:hypothetical protein GGS20DRAFT_376490 [Poronia punctata]